jgi:hypothetical protein
MPVIIEPGDLTFDSVLDREQFFLEARSERAKPLFLVLLFRSFGDTEALERLLMFALGRDL